MPVALKFVESFRNLESVNILAPDDKRCSLFVSQCRKAAARFNLTPTHAMRLWRWKQAAIGAPWTGDSPVFQECDCCIRWIETHAENRNLNE